MSAHQVSVGTAPSHTVKVTEGQWTNLYVIGQTTLKTVPPHATYKVYGLDGKNVAQGPLPARHGIWNDGPHGLGASLELDFEKKPGQFRLQIPLKPATNNYGDDGKGHQWVNFGIDVFLEGSGTHEGICVQVSNHAYATAISSKVTPAFETECKDNGDGTWTPGKQQDVIHNLGGCNEFGKECDGCMTQCNPQSRQATLEKRGTFLKPLNATEPVFMTTRLTGVNDVCPAGEDHCAQDAGEPNCCSRSQSCTGHYGWPAGYRPWGCKGSNPKVDCPEVGPWECCPGGYGC